MKQESMVQLHQIQNNGKKVVYEYSATGSIGQYLKPYESLWIEYEEDVSEVPDAVLMIPFVGNMLALGMLFDAVIKVPVIERDFYSAIPQILSGYREMYADRGIIGATVLAEKVIDVISQKDDNVKLLYYSGGVDCAYSLIKHLKDEEKIDLIQIHGADIPHDNIDGWNTAIAFTYRIAEEYNVNLHTVRSNLHTFIYQGSLDAYVQEYYSEDFWHGFQHSIGMLTLSAPLAWKCGYKEIYFASTFSEKEGTKRYTCASSPTIDNFVRFIDCHVVHDGVEASRQDKLHAIVQYNRTSGKSMLLRVCYLSERGDNCCECEKCIRTAFALYAEGENPNDYGFRYTEDQLSDAVNTYAFTGKEIYYADIQNVLRENRSIEQIPTGLHGFYMLPFEEWWGASKCVKLQKKMYQDLKSWTDNLQSAKDWLDEQYHSQKTKIEELQTICQRQEKELQQQREMIEQQKEHIQKHSFKGFIKKIFK